MKAINTIKELAELEGKPINDTEAQDVYTKLANTYIDTLLKEATRIGPDGQILSTNSAIPLTPEQIKRHNEWLAKNPDKAGVGKPNPGRKIIINRGTPNATKPTK